MQQRRDKVAKDINARLNTWICIARGSASLLDIPFKACMYYYFPFLNFLLVFCILDGRHKPIVKSISKNQAKTYLRTYLCIHEAILGVF